MLAALPAMGRCHDNKSRFKAVLHGLCSDESVIPLKVAAAPVKRLLPFEDPGLCEQRCGFTLPVHPYFCV